MTLLRIALLILVAALAAPVVPAIAQDKPLSNTEMEILRQKISADKKLVVASNMDLSEADAKAFWPIYDAYQKELQQINERIGKGLAAYAEAYNQGKGSIPDATAKKLLDEMVAIEEAEVALKRTYIPKLNAVLPPAKVARYIQMETKIRALVRFDLAANVPLVK
jgi:hypothetical protein